MDEGQPRTTRGAKVQRVLPFILLGAGFITIHMFFFSFIALLIGIGLFILHKGSKWKLHGIVLASCASISTLVADKGTGMSPLYLAFYYGSLIYIIYIVTFITWEGFLRKRHQFNRISTKLGSLINSLSQRARVSSMIILIILPTMVWSSVNINLGVMFDNEQRLLWVHAPTTVDIGSTFELTVEAWDAYERLSATYKGQVNFSIESYNLTTYTLLPLPDANLPEPYTFTGQFFGSDIAYEIRDGRDNGLHMFTAVIYTPGIHYILVKDSVTQNTYYSNPIIVQDMAVSDSRIYWGDFHSHTMLSDGTGTVEHAFYFGRYIARLDYCSSTEHAELMTFNLDNFDILESVTNIAYDPGHFVTFHGIEWTQVTTGHYTCIFNGDQLIKDPILSYFNLPTTDLLWDALDTFTDSTECQALALPHHTTQNAYVHDWTFNNPKYVRIAEVTSVHGEFLFEQRHPLNYVGAIDPPSEYLNGSSIMDGLRMGYRMTLYASSDEHDGHPGHSLSHTPAYVGHQRPWSYWQTRNEHPYPGGLTAVYAQNLTRESIFEGLYQQRVFANSDHGRPYLYFTINGTEVGDGSTVLVNDATAAREIRVIIAQDGSPAGIHHTATSVTSNWEPDWSSVIEIFKNGEILTRISIDGPVNSIIFLDTDPIMGASYGTESCIEIDGQYYINSHSDNPINPAELNTDGADFYLIRVVGNNGRTSYIGPIWVEVGP